MKNNLLLKTLIQINTILRLEIDVMKLLFRSICIDEPDTCYLRSALC